MTTFWDYVIVFVIVAAFILAITYYGHTQYKEGYRDGEQSKAKVAKCPICGEHWTYYGGYVPEVYGNDRTHNDHHPS